jgi:hypothetical protein
MATHRHDDLYAQEGRPRFLEARGRVIRKQSAATRIKGHKVAPPNGIRNTLWQARIRQATGAQAGILADILTAI